MIVHDNKTYRVDGTFIVDNNTNIVVCQELATKICKEHNILLAKNENAPGGRIDTAYLNDRLKMLLKKQ
jgi:hypothetical protein